GCPPFLINNTAIGLQPNPANSQYHWYANNVLIGSGVDFPGYTLPAANDSVMIKLVTVSANGCKPDSMSHEFFTYKLPSPSFTLSGNEGCGPLSILVNNTTADIDIHNYQWDFG